MATKVKIPSGKKLFSALGQLMMLSAQWPMVRDHIKSVAKDDAVVAGFIAQVEEIVKAFTVEERKKAG